MASLAPLTEDDFDWNRIRATLAGADPGDRLIDPWDDFIEPEDRGEDYNDAEREDEC